ncbi:hypothetical protein PFICI_12193 [Pestalotiopsis fici W106-1]|uniref:Major facilitator superfamily (MFS) profile domain-containing protein n=1 Tax=Pestalotiopsis fici (strain W106-1 / CGMCC3.15140) TaxID=1229662 RepID=W3WVE1_PESFW|nr:uncharacterized protein PFICI_12193 [Pestalotiopsis fici W106-1]ETS76806.1 hypothetical protein PFICI_12193 [Pestalotiopsis fici W106-1]
MGGSNSQPTYRDLPNNTASCWWKDSCLRRNVLYGVGCMMCPFYLGFDQSLLTGLQALPQWTSYFNHPSSTLLGLMSAAIFLPGIFMGFVAAWICGRWGRKNCVLVGATLMIVGGIWNALSADTAQFIGSRVILGTGGAITKVAAPALLQETAHPRLRPAMGNMYYGFYYVGSLLSAIVCIIGLYIDGEWGWRMPCMLMILGPIMAISILITAPESPRFLVKLDKTDEALSMLAKHHANGDREDPLVKWEFHEITAALEHENAGKNASYSDFFKTRGNRKRLAVSLLIAVGVNWVGNGIVSYYLSPVLRSIGIAAPSELLGINAGIAAFNLIISEAAGYNIDRFGRRPLFLISTIGMIFSYAFVMGFSAGFAYTHTAALGIAAVPFLFLFYGFYDIAWTPLNYSYCVEIMPYNIRAKGLAIYLCVQQIANAFNQFVNPIALAAITWKYYAVYIAVDCVYVVLIYLYFPETKQLTIEEVSLIFDYDMKEGRQLAIAAFEARMGGDQWSDQTKDGENGASNHVEFQQNAFNNKVVD